MERQFRKISEKNTESKRQNLIEESKQRLIIQEGRVYQGRDIMSREQEEICKEEIFIRREKVGMIPEEDLSLEDIIGESQ